jgi:23S rRNA (cytosine1962-C5)-methyltransferase
MVGLCGGLLSDDASFLILNAYAARISGASMAGLVAQAVNRPGRIDWGELALVEQAGVRQVGLSFFARWSS